MGLSFLGRNENANTGARGSTLGPGLVETENPNNAVDYKPSGIQGAAPGSPTSLEILAKKDEILRILTKLRGQIKERGVRGMNGLSRR